MDPIHWFIYLYSCIGMYRNGENQKFVYLSWDIFTTDLLPNPILQNNFIKKSAKKQHMEKLKVVLSPYWHDVTTVKKSLESKNSAHSDVNSMWNESKKFQLNWMPNIRTTGKRMSLGPVRPTLAQIRVNMNYTVTSYA